MTGKRKGVSAKHKPCTKKSRETTYTTNSTQTSPQIIKGDELVVVIRRIPRRKVLVPITVTKDNIVPQTCEEKLPQIFEEKTRLNTKTYGLRGKSNENKESNNHFDQNRVNKSTLKDKNRNFVGTRTEEGEENSSGNMSSLIFHLKDQEMSSKLPQNYDNFIKPISNNQNVNSTLDSITTDKDRENETINIANIQALNLKNKNYIKPGPKCSKPKNYVLKESENVNITNIQAPTLRTLNYIRPGPKCTKSKNYCLEDTRISIMLNGNSEESTNLTLSPIIERSNECTPLQGNLSVPIERSIISERSQTINSASKIGLPIEMTSMEYVHSVPMANENLSGIIEPPLVTIAEKESIPIPNLTNDVSNNYSDDRDANLLEKDEFSRNVEHVIEAKRVPGPSLNSDIPTSNTNQEDTNLLPEEFVSLQKHPSRATQYETSKDSDDLSENEQININNIQFDYESYTTIIKARDRRNKNAEEDDESSIHSNPNCHSHKKQKRKQRKYIIIKAKTVHIHNHFYNK